MIEGTDAFVVFGRAIDENLRVCCGCICAMQGEDCKHVNPSISVMILSRVNHFTLSILG